MDDLFLFLFLASIGCLIVGMIKPSLFSRFLKEKASRKKVGLIFGSSILLSLILFGITYDEPIRPKQEEKRIVEKKKLLPKPTDKPIIQSTAPPTTKLTVKPTVRPSVPTKTKQKEVKLIEPEPVQETKSETVSQKNAVAKVKSYLNYSAFSHDGLVDQLEYEQFSHSDAVYGADNSGADWNEQAAKKAKSYMEYSAFSRGGLIDQLLYEKFTREQAEYGANSVGL